MNIIALEYSTNIFSLALKKENKIFQKNIEMKKFSYIDIIDVFQKMKETYSLSIEDITCIAFGNGPGRFIGLRLVYAFSQSLGYIFKKPIYQISSLNILAQTIYRKTKNKKVNIYIKAGIKDLYHGSYKYNEILDIMEPIEKDSFIYHHNKKNTISYNINTFFPESLDLINLIKSGNFKSISFDNLKINYLKNNNTWKKIIMLLKNKNILILGISNKYSIAFHIAKYFLREGANIFATYQNEKIKQFLIKYFKNSINIISLYEAQNIDTLKKLYKKVTSYTNTIHTIIHSIAFADSRQFKKRFIDMEKKDFLISQEISCYSLISIVKNFLPLLNSFSSIITFTYLGSKKVIPSYNIMGPVKSALESIMRYMAKDLGEYGIRINAISPGPIKTVSSRIIQNFSNILQYNKRISPLKKNIIYKDIANAAIFFASDLSLSITTVHPQLSTIWLIFLAFVRSIKQSVLPVIVYRSALIESCLKFLRNYRLFLLFDMKNQAQDAGKQCTNGDLHCKLNNGVIHSYQFDKPCHAD